MPDERPPVEEVVKGEPEDDRPATAAEELAADTVDETDPALRNFPVDTTVAEVTEYDRRQEEDAVASGEKAPGVETSHGAEEADTDARLREAAFGAPNKTADYEPPSAEAVAEARDEAEKDEAKRLAQNDLAAETVRPDSES